MRETINGMELAFSDGGAGVPLLFVHGFPLSRGAWSRQVAAFQASHRVIVPDLRGLGESQAGQGPVSMLSYAADLQALLLHLNTGPVVLIGHSMGGYVALAFAKAFPGSLRGLVLVGTKAGADTPEAAAARRASAEKVGRDGSAEVIASMAAKMLRPGNADPAMAAEVRQIMAGAGAEGVAGALLGMAERPDFGPWLGELRQPTLVISGADDVIMPPAEAEALARAIPGAELQLVAGAGHLVALEQAAAFNEVLRTWLAARGLE